MKDRINRNLSSPAALCVHGSLAGPGLTLLRDAILHRLKAQGWPSVASPFAGRIVHWTIRCTRLTHGEPVRPEKAPLALSLNSALPMYARQRPSLSSDGLEESLPYEAEQ